MTGGLETFTAPPPTGDPQAPSPDEGRWPPVAVPAGRDLAAWQVAAIAVVLVAIAIVTSYVLSSRVAIDPTLDPEDRTRGLLLALILGSLVTVAITSLTALALGWQRRIGLGPGVAAPWAVVPIAALWVAVFSIAGRLGAVDVRGSTVGLLVVAIAVAAFSEEVLFRGIVLHGFVRALGGRAGVYATTFAFALAHVPRLVASGRPGASILVALIVIGGVGGLLCRIRVASGALWFPTLAHTLYNVTIVGAVLPGSSGLPISVALAAAVTGIIEVVRMHGRTDSGGRRPCSADADRIPPRPDLGAWP